MPILPIALTQGDPSGIGVEIALKAWLRRSSASAPFFLLGNPDHVAATAARLALAAPVRAAKPSEACAMFTDALPVVALSGPVTGAPGRPDQADALATIEAIERAVALVRAGEACAVVTNPISKDVLYRAGFRHPGHTEFLGELAERFYGVAAHPVMMLWCEQLAVVPVTVHVALEKVFAGLSSALLMATGRIVARELREKFGIAKPRLAFAGLNPHAGENGAMGRQEIEIIGPAIDLLRAEGLDVAGPLPADTMFHAAARARYDAALCMYHDQALIPIKTLAFDCAVNITLGLPFVRTSPDHGTAYDIAGRGLASCASLEAALALASRLACRAP
ncbi:MAG TPA: 4-hydroxythreonine-4-phosphate dehydrogenase PdxA [Beijerinckiaceae bacterium]|nr:4-hydroxythreonine-4-phosphate dehydrogenase PdxA [Beijerinckiaceae bacterium]